MEVKFYNEIFVWTEIKVELDNEAKAYRIVPLEGLYPIELDDTTDMVRDYFENDLINGPDNFLVHVWNADEDSYTFEIIMKTTDPDEFFEYIHPLARSVIDIDPDEATVMTLKCR